MLAVRDGLRADDWASVERSIKAGEELLTQLGTSQKRDTEPDASNIGLPEECAQEFRLVEMEMADRNVIAYV